MSVTFSEFLDHVYIINLPEFEKRRHDTLRELAGLGFSPNDARVEVPFAPRPTDANLFPSRGVYGNFLSHLNILKDARAKGYKRILVLEDDAIFSHRMLRTQRDLINRLEHESWDICFLGHSADRELKNLPKGLVRSQAEFIWMHCIIVNNSVYDRLIKYFEDNIKRPPGHPLGGRMYIDGAYNMFRRLNPDVVAYLHNPAISLQRGGVSSLGNRRFYDDIPILRPVLAVLRSLRDEFWKRFV